MAAFPNGSLVDPPGGFFGWGEWGSGTFNAIHMSLIPKGPYRGHVLVWNRYPVFIDVGAPYLGTARYWACQAWSIVNPAPTAPAPRFRNFLLPLEPWGNSPPSLGSTVSAADLFCSGHAWSPSGNLVVAGGARFDFVPGVSLTESGAKFLFVFDPSAPSAPFPGHSTSLYPGEVGRWMQQSGAQPNTVLELAADRYYPTVLLTHRLSRTGLVETVVVAGGFDPNQTSTLPGGNNPWNTYESYIVRDPSGPLPFLQEDVVGGQRTFRGPGTSPSTDLDWFLEYPRLHLLSDGTIFMSGWAPNGVRWNPEFPALTFPPTGASAYDYTRGIGSTSAWNQTRHDGTTVFLARFGLFQDVVVRLGGEDGGTATPTSELCFAGGLNAPWVSLGNMPGAVPGRAHPNAVVLPDGSILVIGGDQPGGLHESKVVLYQAGINWTDLTVTPTERRYHTTTMLLPDGRVLVGGGEGRNSTAVLPAPHDYDLYEPPYLRNGALPTGVTLPGTAQDAEGTYLLVPGQFGITIEALFPGLDLIDRAVLIAPGSLTHHSDMSARYVELEGEAVAKDQLIVRMPSETVAPRGYYMLFAISKGGLPAHAVWVRLQ